MDSRARSMSTKGESLYLILGIEKSSTPDEVKKAYRKLALKCHPDKNPDNPTAIEQFKEINHAHSVLSDQTKRSIYDQYGSLGLYVAEQFGEDNVNAYFVLTSPLAKGLVVFCCLITGCCCCCCCCMCCNFCCGKFKPQPPPDEEFDLNVDDLDGEEEGAKNDSSAPLNAAPVTAQPGMPTVGEQTGLKTNEPTSYETA